MIRSFLIFVILLWAIPIALPAQMPVLVEDPEFRQAAQAAIDSLYNRKPEAAQELLKPWMNDLPDHPLWTLFDAMDYWWVVLTDLFDESHDDELMARMNRADSEASELLDREPDHPDGWIIRAVATGYMARQLSNRNRWLPSIYTARKAQHAHSRLGEVAPNLVDNLFAEGLKKYYAAYLPEAYPVVRAVSWLLPSGDKEEGLRLLEITSREAVFARPEATYFLGNILLNYEEEYNRAVPYFSELVDRYPDNSYYRRLQVRALFHQGAGYLAEQAIRDAVAHWERHSLPDMDVMKEELLYWSGRIKMRDRQYQAALEELKESFELGKSLPNTTNRSLHLLSGYHAGIAAERLQDRDAARSYYEAILEMDAEQDVRRRARDRLRDL
ncbi:MAG: tetratricopeptide repeat protein [Balneolaceae bacterium]